MDIKENSFKAWVKACRPITLTGAIAPVLLALALAFSDISTLNDFLSTHGHQLLKIKWIPAVLCISFAIVMQIDANLINDYYDWKKGIDTSDRLGPKRACAQGWITPSAMIKGIIMTTILAIVIGSPLIYYGGFYMVLVGVACVLFCFLYSFILSRYAMGDILVILFFGIVPVCTTYYLQIHGITIYQRVNGAIVKTLMNGLPYRVLYISIAQGLVTECLLIVNNFRDRETDKMSKKITLVTLIGETATQVLYMMLGIIAIVLCLPMVKYHHHTFYLTAIYVIPHFIVWNKMCNINKGKELNKVLGWTSLNIILFALLVSLGVNI